MIEQAKGVLAHQDHLSMEAAYERLLTLAQERRLSLSEASHRVIDRAQDRTP